MAIHQDPMTVQPTGPQPAQEYKSGDGRRQVGGPSPSSLAFPKLAAWPACEQASPFS